MNTGTTELNKWIFRWVEKGETGNSDFFHLYVRLMRQRQGLSREEFAEQISMKQAQLIAIENRLVGLRDLRLAQRWKIEAKLGMSYYSFIVRLRGILISEEELRKKL